MWNDVIAQLGALWGFVIWHGICWMISTVQLHQQYLLCGIDDHQGRYTLISVDKLTLSKSHASSKNSRRLHHLHLHLADRLVSTNTHYVEIVALSN